MQVKGFVSFFLISLAKLLYHLRKREKTEKDDSHVGLVNTAMHQ